MNYQINVLFESPTCPSPITLSDFITDEDWTNLNYWDDISHYASNLIIDGESLLEKIFPDGHDYFLSTVNITRIGDVEE